MAADACRTRAERLRVQADTKLASSKFRKELSKLAAIYETLAKTTESLSR
jgi:hypothetical protein